MDNKPSFWDKVEMFLSGKSWEERQFSKKFPNFCFQHRLPKDKYIYMETSAWRGFVCYKCYDEYYADLYQKKLEIIQKAREWKS
jgi:hypothetical protein